MVLTCRLCGSCGSSAEAGGDLASVEDQVVKKLEQFNSVCDELFKEIVRPSSQRGRGCERVGLWSTVASSSHSLTHSLLALPSLLSSSGERRNC